MVEREELCPKVEPGHAGDARTNRDFLVTRANLNFLRLSLAPGFSRVKPVVTMIKPVSTGFPAHRSR
jgi:hypothetical protein